MQKLCACATGILFYAGMEPILSITFVRKVFSSRNFKKWLKFGGNSGNW
jgi:hypothetical protein